MDLVDTPSAYATQSPVWHMRSMVLGHVIPRCIYVVAQLDIATRLAGGARTATELANEAGASGVALYRVLRALASAGVFRETSPARFENTPLSETLRSDAPGSLRAWALMHGDEISWRSWGEFSYSVSTGRSAFEHLYGMNTFEYQSRNPARAAIFNEAMSAITAMASDALVAACDLSDLDTVVDVGGGNGTLLCTMLKANPALKGIVFDLPHIEPAAKSYISNQRLQVRCSFVGGDFFESVPSGADAYVLQRVLHDWDDEHSIAILRRCSEAARRGARLLISEAIIAPGNEPFYGKLIDLHMLVITHGGKERAEEEYRGLLAKSGWQYTRIITTSSPFSLVEGVKS